MKQLSSLASVAVACALLMTHAVTVRADEEHRFQITPLVGYRGGGEFDAFVGTQVFDAESSGAYGVALNMSAGEGRQYELIYNFQPTEIEDLDVDLDIETLHIGGSATYLTSETMIPYIAGGIGATRLKPDRGDDETRFSASLALGVGRPINDRIRVRLEVRGYFVTMAGNSRIFCGSGAAGGGCVARASGDVFFQYEALAGIAIGFGPATR